MARTEAAVRIKSIVIGPRYELKRATWQLPCGHVNAWFWTSNEMKVAYCTTCWRGWKHMTTHCQMLDGQPQGRRRYAGKRWPAVEFHPD